MPIVARVQQQLVLASVSSSTVCLGFCSISKMPGLGRGLALLLLLLAAPAPTAAVKVWGLCPGRTGTDSLKQAFVEMGLGPAYHMKEILIEEAGVSTAGHVEAWHKAANGVPVDLVKLLKDFVTKNDEFCITNEELCIKTMNFVSKTMSFVFKK